MSMKQEVALFIDKLERRLHKIGLIDDRDLSPTLIRAKRGKVKRLQTILTELYKLLDFCMDEE